MTVYSYKARGEDWEVFADGMHVATFERNTGRRGYRFYTRDREPIHLQDYHGYRHIGHAIELKAEMESTVQAAIEREIMPTVESLEALANLKAKCKAELLAHCKESARSFAISKHSRALYASLCAHTGDGVPRGFAYEEPADVRKRIDSEVAKSWRELDAEFISETSNFSHNFRQRWSNYGFKGLGYKLYPNEKPEFMSDER